MILIIIMVWTNLDKKWFNRENSNWNWNFVIRLSKIFEEIIEEILSCLENGNDVKISNFGTFSVKKKSSRLGRNPKTGDEKEITARNVISFYPSKALKRKIS